MLRYSDPMKLRTKRVIFENAFHARDSGTLEQLKELSSRRKIIEVSVNGENLLTEAIAREMSGGLTSKTQQDLQKLEVYLPLLENLVSQVGSLNHSPKILRWISDLQIRWSSALSEPSVFNFGGPKLYKIDKLQLELGICIYLYGALLRERAFEILSQDTVEAVAFYRKAAGVYIYLANQLLPPLQTSLPYERPLEVVSSMSEIMSLICLAEAQAVTIKKAEERNRSPGLLSKLHFGVTQMLDKAASILMTNAGVLNDVSARLQEFISLSSFLHQTRSQRRLAEELVVQHRSINARGQLGVAIGILRLATAKLNALKTSKDESWQWTLDQEMANVAELLRKYEHDNEFVYGEKVPDPDQLPFLQGMKIVEAISYHPQRWERHLEFVT